jgi:RHS repeat-associated protein
VSYVDGFGRPIQTKLRAEAGPAIQRNSAGAVIIDGDGKPVLAPSGLRWLTTGNDVYNNKGWVVRKYEPFFSTRADFESDEALCRYGVATRTHYDPVGRIVRQDLPNGSFATSVYTAWETRKSDANDNVVGSAYEAERYALPGSDPEKDALTKAQAHAQTPIIIENEVSGRPFRLREIGGAGTTRITTTRFGVFGLPDQVIDPRKLTALTYRYDMLGRAFFKESIDSGAEWTLFDSQGRIIHRWDARDVHIQNRYDQNGRLTETKVDDARGLNNVVQRVVYGDNPVVLQSKLKNARGQMVSRYDDVGVVRFEKYHIDGQAIDTRRFLRSAPDAHKKLVDWTNVAAVAMDTVQYRSQKKFDGLGRVVIEILPDGTTREYDYAATGHVAEVRLTTADTRLNRKIIASKIETNARGQRTQMRLGNGVETTYEYDTRTFQLQRLHTYQPIGSVRDYVDVEYTYDPVGNITRWIDHAQNPSASVQLIQGLTTSSACEFTYDAFYQLKVATGRVHQALLEHDYRDGLSDPSAIKGTRHLSLNNGAAIERYIRTYDYDLSGNIQRIRHQGITKSWTTEIWTSPTSNRSLPKKDPNGIDIVNPESRFDENGNTLYLPHLRLMEWNYNNRLARVVITDRSTSSRPDDAEYYVYEADALRARRVTERLVAGQVEVTETIYFEGFEIRRISRGGNIRLLRQTSHISDGTASLATLHQWSIDQSGLETNNIAEKKLHYLVGNHLGSTSLELDEAGGVISYEEYFPYGGTSFIAGNDARDVKLKEYRYSGKLRDDTTGFYCYEYRYYAPFIGNWLSPDPLGSADGLNLYCFVHNNPIRFVDNEGLQTSQGVLAPGPVINTESEAINYYNREWAFERGRRITNLNRTPEKPGWWSLPEGGTRPLTQSERERISKILSIRKKNSEAADVLFTLEELSKQAPQPVTSSEEVTDTKTNQTTDQTNETNSEVQSSVGEGPGKGEEKKEKGGGGKDEKTQGLGLKGVGLGPESQLTGDGERSDELLPVPPGLPIGEDGIPYTPDLQLPEVLPEAGIPVTDPSQIRFGTVGGDDRSGPASESRSEIRTDGNRNSERNSANGDQRGEGRERQLRANQPSTLDKFTRWAGVLNGIFDAPKEGGESGGVPGGLGLFNVKGSAIQVLYIGATIISTVFMIQSIVKSVSLAALRQGLGRLAGAIRAPVAALRGLLSSARVFGEEAVQALGWARSWIARGQWSEFFRIGRWGGPGQSLRVLFHDVRAWASIQRWRDHISFLFRPRWFGKSPFYNWEHIFPQSLAQRFPQLEGFLNSYFNSFLRLPTELNSSLGNRLIPKLQFYMGAFEALTRSWRLGWWTGQQILDESK